MVQINEDQRHHVTMLNEQDAQTGVAQLEFNLLYNSIPPISSLPEEVLVMVFEAGTHEQGPDFAVLVSHVTRSWRNIALATPRLWATIRCLKSQGIERSSYPETGKERAAAFLTRSRSSPVDIYIRHCSIDEDLQLLQLLGNHFGCCQHLSIMHTILAYLPEALACFSRQQAPLLESFELGPPKTSWCNFKLKETLFPSGAPRLTTAQITSLDFTTFHLCLTAFQSVTSLRLASIYFDDDDYDGGGGDAYASLREGLMALPSLTHLELQEHCVEVDQPCLPVVLPALQVLRASSPYGYGFQDFLAPCIHGASLAVLTLQGGDPIEQALEFHFPSLRHLILLEVTKIVLDFGILNQFPSIQRLTCQAAASSSHYQSFPIGIADVLAALGPGPREDGDTGHWIPCFQLNTVAVSAAYWSLDVLALKSQISMLRDNDVPIRKLMLPESSLTQPDDDLEAIAELRKLVEIEDFQIDWPTPFDNEWFTEL